MKNNRNYRPAGRDKTRPEASRRPVRSQSRPQEEESARGMQREDIVIGRNGVIELLKSGRAVESILVTGGETQGSIVKILAMAKEQGIPVKETSPAKLDNMCGHQNHQGVIAVTGAANYSTMEDIYKKAGDQPLFVIINSYTTGLAPSVLGYLLDTLVTKKYGGHTECQELGLPVTASGLALPCGATGRWMADRGGRGRR